MTDTFFDLQRFANPVLEGTDTGFEWDSGEFVGGVSTANVGTQSNPAYWAETGGVPAVEGSEVYLTGKPPQAFSLDGKPDWSIALGGDNTLQVTKAGTSLALGTWSGTDTAVLAINGEYAESTGTFSNIYIKSTGANIVSLNAAGYTVGEGADGVLVGLDGEKAGMVNFAGNNSNISLASGTDTASADIAGGFGFEKYAQAYNAKGDIGIWTDSNTITLPAGNVLALKVTDPLLTGSATLTKDAVTGATGGATLTTSTGLSGVTINGTTWNEIAGNLSTIEFDSVGAATVNNSGAVVVEGEEGAQVTIKNLDTAGATVNSIGVATALTETETVNVAFVLESGGISSIDVSKATGRNLVVTGDKELNITAGTAEYVLSTDADDVTFNATASRVNVAVANEKSYEATGGNAQFLFAETATAVSLNGAAVSVGAADGVTATASEATAGIDNLNGLAAGTKVSVSGDSDGFVVNYNAASDSGTFEVNGASINAAGIDGQSAQISVGASATEVTVKGLQDTAQVSVAGGTAGMTYHFKNEESSNVVKVAAGETMYVTLDGTGAVADYIDEDNYKKLQAVEDQWDNISSIGSSSDSLPADHAPVYEQFYALGSASAAAGNVSVATFANEDSTTFDTVSNPTGIELRGSDILSAAGHITMTAGAAVGPTPINIQANESDNVFDVVLDLRNAGAASTVAIGTLGEVSASHEVSLSNAGVGYAYLGSGSTGQNRIFAGTAGAQIRHDGSTRATITGNRGNDTIWAGANDIVTGGAGADAFYDTASYTIQDYSATDGDVLIATRIDSVNDITKDNIRSAGNQVGFGTGNKMLTIGDEQSDPLLVKVAVMDTNADIVGTPRNVALASKNGGALDASALDAAALIIADSDRNTSSDNVIGSASNDTIYVGAGDSVNGGAGNDSIIAESVSGDAGITVELSAGRDTISGWTFGFDKNAGATELIAAEGYQAEFDTDRLKITDSNGSILIDDTSDAIDQNHGEAKMLINGTKWMAIRTDDENKGYFTSYGNVESNDEIADFYIAEREGFLRFESGVTEDLGEIHLSRYYAPTNYQDITYLKLDNNSKADVYGTSERETVEVGGEAAYGANKRVSLGAGNDVIISSGDSSVTAGHMFYFGANDGLDTIQGFGHYLGIEQDPDKQYADTLIVEKHGGIYTGTDENSGVARIDFYTEGENRIAIYEANGINVDNVYQIKVGAFDTKLAKIGNSSGTNVFTYNSDVDYYVGSSAENAQDTLNVGNEIANANVWLDGTNGTYDTNADEQYYRGIAVVNASAETNTNVALAGNGNNNTLYGGGIGTNNSLWGGAGNNVLNGSTEGQDTFFYVRNAGAYLQGVDDTVTGGNDTVYNYNLDKGDIVWLGDTTVDDILNTEVGDNSVVVNFKNGGSLTVEGSDDVRFLINSGTESWVTNKDSESDNKWTQES